MVPQVHVSSHYEALWILPTAEEKNLFNQDICYIVDWKSKPPSPQE